MKSNFNIVYLFSGQGSQYRGMGQMLFENNIIFKTCLEEYDSIINKFLGRSLIDELYSISHQQFDDLLITHPAIVAVEIAIYNVLNDASITPDYIVGSSLGAFAAGVASGIWSAEEAIGASIRQADAIIKLGVTGGMLAVIHPKEELEHLYRKHELFIASDNFRGHFTVTGLTENVNSFQLELTKLAIPFQRLPVKFPFHSLLLEQGQERFNDYMVGISPLKKPNSGFISGIDGEEICILPGNYFWDSISKYSNFRQVVRTMENKGPCMYVDLGPSGTSTTFVKYNLEPTSSSQIFPIVTPFKRDLQQLELVRKKYEEIGPIQQHNPFNKIEI